VHVTVDRAQPEDQPAILGLLTDNGLPTDGLLDHLESAVVARLEGRVVACAALEIYPDGALLRSVAVENTLRGRGSGIKLSGLRWRSRASEERDPSTS
jgi:N-acetylglutamate synthase-like GNAT family acetyltransferase